jgi:cell division protein ZapA
MCVLHYATTALKAEWKLMQEDTDVTEKVHQLDQLLTDFFSK